LNQRLGQTGWVSSGACSELALPEILSKGRSSQEPGFFLWKAVQKEGCDGAELIVTAQTQEL
jgi:hypothetical protein